MMTTAGVKRKYIGIKDGGESLIYLLFGSRLSPKPAALFKLKLRHSGAGKGEGDGVYPKSSVLKPIQMFYQQITEKPMGYVACVPLGCGEYFVLPNEIDRALSLNDEVNYFPFIFDAKTMTTVRTAPPPLRPMVTPLAAAVDGKVYVLSRRTLDLDDNPVPSFESYDPIQNLWKPLDRPWFSIDTHPRPVMKHHPIGFAVVGIYILVCLALTHRGPGHFQIWSYNTTSNEWQPVKSSPFDDDDDDDDDEEEEEEEEEYDDDGSDYSHEYYRRWAGEAVFRNGFLYGYGSACQALLSFSCEMPSKEKPCLSLGSPNILMDFRCPYRGRNISQSCALALIDDDLLCVVLTADIGYWLAPQHVHIFVLCISEPGTCTTIADFEVSMPSEELFHCAKITSCLLMQPELDTSMDNEEHGGKKLRLTERCDDSMDSDVEMLEGTIAMATRNVA